MRFYVEPELKVLTFGEQIQTTDLLTASKEESYDNMGGDFSAW